MDYWTYGPIPSTLPGGRRMTRSLAWDRCRKAGEAVGIPQHAWCKAHSRYGWSWVTMSPEAIARIEEAKQED